MATGWATVKIQDGRSRAPKLKDIFDVIEPPAGTPGVYRLFGPISSIGEHWLRIRIMKDGAWKNVSVYKICLNYHPSTGELEDNGCPYCEAVGVKARYLQNAIDRDVQDHEPKNRGECTKKVRLGYAREFPAYVKEKGDRLWTPVGVLAMPPSVGEKLQKLTMLNRVKGKVYDVSDLEHGRDLYISYDKDAKSASNIWEVIHGDPCGITSEERRYPMWDIFNTSKLPQPEKLQVAEEAYAKLRDNLVKDGDKGGDDAPKARNRRSYSAEDDDDDAPPRRQSKKRPYDDDEEDYDDLPRRKKHRYEEDDEDEAPPRKRRASPQQSDEEYDEEIPF